MDIRQLRTFVHVAELGSISAAADRLRIAQPALSRQLQALEQELGVRLFQRHGRGVALTEEGGILLTRATVVLRELDQARDELKGASGELGGKVAFGLPPTVADILAGPLVERFSALFPKVKLSISSGYSGYVLDWLQRGIIDVAVLYESRHLKTINARPLILEKLFLIEPPDIPDAGPVPFASLAGRNLILPSRQHGLRILLDSVAAELGESLDPVIETDSLPLQLDLVRRGFGVTVLPLITVEKEIAAGQVVVRPLHQPEVTRRLVLATPIDRPVSRAVRLFAETAETVVRQLSESRGWQAIPVPAEP